MRTLIKTNINQYKQDTSGQFGVVFALLAVPLVAISTLALDHSFAQKERARLSNALDNTALASILNQTLSEDERADYANTFFKQFFDESQNIDLKVLESGNNRVSLVAETNVPTTVASIIGKKNFTVNDTAVSELTEGAVVCMLALDPDGEHSFEVTQGAQFQANTCSVQVNSTHKHAAVVHNGSRAMAKDFCISGGVETVYGVDGQDKFLPFANTDCSMIPDPYQHRRIPAPGACLDAKTLDETLNHWHASIFEPFEYVDGSSGVPQTIRVDGGVTLQPGTYCGGLSLDAKNITFLPGEYIIKDGPLFFGLGTRAFGEDVTFIFAGNEASLQITGGADVNLSAPRKGDLGGLVFAQYTETRLGADAHLPNAKSVITAGGNLRLVGTAYLPEHKVIFNGGSISAAQAPATSFIAYQILLDEAAKINIAVDHQQAGLPPILPRSDESARLVE